MNTMTEKKCEVCGGTRCVYRGPIGDPSDECEACADQEPDSDDANMADREAYISKITGVTA